ncbi:MAG TPA: type II toxin-antitoxin system VapC family toxin [Reyranella sp.]|nr:type II toxin-antitoxin system VapC family toxin [Reyranella sp.]
MKFLLDTHILLWAATSPNKLSRKTRRLLEDTENALVFSVVSLWEVVVKRSLERDDFQVDPRELRRGLIDNGYEELPVTGAHALALEDLPSLHKDPFDRMLLAQARVEGLSLLTADERLLQYPGAVQKG